MFYLSDVYVNALKNVELVWNNTEEGAPMIDPKRPYGDMEIEEAMGVDLDDIRENADEEAVDKAIDMAYSQHEKILTALQIVLDTGGMIVGYYEKDSTDRWILVD